MAATTTTRTGCIGPPRPCNDPTYIHQQEPAVTPPAPGTRHLSRPQCTARLRHTRRRRPCESTRARRSWTGARRGRRASQTLGTSRRPRGRCHNRHGLCFHRREASLSYEPGHVAPDAGPVAGWSGGRRSFGNGLDQSTAMTGVARLANMSRSASRAASISGVFDTSSTHAPTPQ